MFILITLHISNCDLFLTDACRLSIMLFDVLQARESRGTARKECRIWNKAKLRVQKWHLRQRLLRHCLSDTIQCTSWKSLLTLEAAHRVTEIWLGILQNYVSAPLIFFIFPNKSVLPLSFQHEHALNVEYETVPGSVVCDTSTSYCKQSEWVLFLRCEEHFFFLRKSSVAGSLQCCYGSVANVLHSDIIVVLNGKVRFDLSFIYKSWHNPRQRCTMHSWSSVSLWNVELEICWLHEAFVMHRDFTVWSFSRSHTPSWYSVVF